LIDTDLNLSGSVAQYGRTSGMIQSVAAQIISQFAAALRGEIAESHAPATTAPTPDATPPAATPAATETAVPPAAKPISGFTLMFRALLEWLRSVLRRSPDKG
jgi:uncharacterized protein